jgi:homoserine dehydrogenase
MRADLALVGYGHVGRRFAALILERRQQLLDDHDIHCRVIGIATRRHGSLFDPAGVDTNEATARLTSTGSIAPEGAGPDAPPDSFALIAKLAASDAPLRVLVETTTLEIADGGAAIGHIEAAIRNRCHAITANKGPAAFAARRLSTMARDAGVSFLFEGAVMDGVPVFNLVRETLPAVTILGVRGIVNSTTNHVLAALEAGEPLAPAVARMQADGIAESDPSLDLDGWDAAAKLAALANVLMGAEISPHDVDRSGIDANTASRAQSARARGLELRLVAAATRTTNGVVARVALEELRPDDPLAGLRGTANALVLRTDLLGDIAIHQPEGALTMTAYALVGDLVTVRRRAG